MAEYRNPTNQTEDLHEELLASLKSLVPSAFPDGDLDVEQLLGALGEKVFNQRGFTFSWPGIDEARLEAQAPTTATLVPDENQSLNWERTQNVLIEGDNLQVLKLLKSSYSRSAKLIYIDPPYNTGDSFTYDDKYSVPETEYLRQTGQVDEHGNVTTSKLEKAGKKHAPWLTMMFPRLVLARHLLRRDGVFLASIDNHEVHHLRVLLDAVFGADNFVDMFTWRGARKGDAKLTGGGQDYILIYARDREWLRKNDVRWRQRKEGLDAIYRKVDELKSKYSEDYETASKKLKKWYDSLADEDPSKAHDQYRFIEERGVFYKGDIASPNLRKNLKFDWKGYSIPDNGWRYERRKMEQLDEDGRLVYPESKDQRITVKRFLHEHEEWAPASVFYKDRRAASNALNKLLGSKVFDDPKSTGVIARLVEAITNEDDLVVDFFAGSGSTGHAVWEQNARDGKNRNWLLIQAPEEPDSSEESGKNAIKAGYKTIFDITVDRLRRAAEKLDDNSLGFRVFRTRPSNLVIEPPIVAEAKLSGLEYVQESLAVGSGAPIIEEAKALDVAWEVIIKSTTFKLDVEQKSESIDSVKVFKFTSSKGEDERRAFVSLDPMTVDIAESLSLGDSDFLVLCGETVDDPTTLTLASRLKENLMLLERVPREVSL